MILESTFNAICHVETCDVFARFLAIARKGNLEIDVTIQPQLKFANHANLRK